MVEYKYAYEWNKKKIDKNKHNKIFYFGDFNRQHIYLIIKREH